MIDTFNIPVQSNNNQIFYNTGGSWQAWNKPANCKFIYFFVVGGGGGGGGGRTSSTNTGPGGGGGASSALVTALFPASVLPDTLYIQVGAGGAGGLGGGSNPAPAGAAGTLSYISCLPDLTNTNLLMQSGAAAPTGGTGAQSSTIQGSGGQAGTVWGYASAIYSFLGVFSVNAGQNGGNGTTNVGTITNITPTLPITGGAGGGYTPNGSSVYAPGGITGSGFFGGVSGGVGNAADATINGNAGVSLIPNLFSSMSEPLFFSGGSGGAASFTVGRAGGHGGAGGYGSGGGGGGGTYTGTGGKGGNGGDGLVIITCL